MQIQTPGVGAALQRLFRLQGRVRPTLEPFILPVVSVADLNLASPPPVIRRATNTFMIGAVAAERPTWRFEVPGSVIAVIKRVWVRPVTVDATFIGNVQSTIPVAGFTQSDSRFVDGRLVQAAELPAGVIVHGTQVASISPFDYRLGAPTAAPQLVIEDLGWVVASGIPGQSSFAEFQLELFNEQTQVTMQWDEFQVF